MSLTEIRLIFVGLLAAVCAGCAAWDTASLVSGESEVRIVMVGQSLIKHDPRRYMENPLAAVRENIAAADVAFTNLEVAINTKDQSCPPAKEGLFFHSGSYDVVEFLAEIGVDLVSLANNHSWDLGACGVLATVEAAAEAGLSGAGTGAGLVDALQPAIVEANGLRIALVAVATTNLPPEATALPTRAGVNTMDIGSEAEWDRNIQALKSAAGAADIVIAYQHYQIREGGDFQQRWARSAIDAGADIYVSHGRPEIAGVETYNGGLILYNLGNFIFHTRTEIGHYEAKAWQSIMAEVRIDARGVKEAVFTPLALNERGDEENFLETRGLPQPAVGDEARAILLKLKELSGTDGDSIVINGAEARIALRK